MLKLDQFEVRSVLLRKKITTRVGLFNNTEVPTKVVAEIDGLFIIVKH